MPNQCTKCGKVFPDAAEELLKGCECGSRFFYYIRQEKFEELQEEVKRVIKELDKSDKRQVEKDIRELTGITKPDEPVILDLESVRVIEPGKFEIDIVNLFAKNRPLIYKLGEGKYIIDITSSLTTKKKGFKKKKRLSTKFLSEVEKEIKNSWPIEEENEDIEDDENNENENNES